jgi:hypothetical protein
LPALAADLVRRQVAIIVAGGHERGGAGASNGELSRTPGTAEVIHLPPDPRNSAIAWGSHRRQ